MPSRSPLGMISRSGRGTKCGRLRGDGRSPLLLTERKEHLQAFALKEHFGVNHADPVVTFELQERADPGQCHLLDDAGEQRIFTQVCLPGRKRPGCSITFREVRRGNRSRALLVLKRPTMKDAT